MSELQKVIRSSNLSVVKANQEYCTETLELKNSIEENFLELGKRLMKIRDEELYAPNWENFGGYIEEMKVSESAASRLITIYAKFVLEFKIAPAQVALAGGWATVSELIPLLKEGTKKEAESWLNKASTLTKSDLRKEVNEARSGIEMKDCKHAETLLFKRCLVCKDTWRVHEE